ncbi:sulfotransferase domain-containing protein [Thiohalobacter sp. IOR34]|uniref:sulfotransferase domain-containing protein n=1 Tax=Thiohalobacter sp. IOR34 TaxID=3057176 RepID=UPI0025B08BD1|nr:sulfotransferase domain-containing protein [Thiohalobacter sp. IOR34]WJW74596.1 sulfotransferase domain-containing protein [Thiohalobacter sp. IOR34]
MLADPMFKGRPIIMSSAMKSGTWMLRAIISELSGRGFFEPQVPPGRPGYEDPSMLSFPKEEFYSWHIIPRGEVAERIAASGARVVFLVRNIYDLAVSVYYHLLDDVDADIGRSVGHGDFLAGFEREQALALAISGYCEPPNDWHGMGTILLHIQEMLRYALQHPVYITSYERLVRNKATEVARLADYLETPLTDVQLREIADSTSFERMRADAEKGGAGKAHFRAGRIGGFKTELSGFHKILLRSLMHNITPDLPRLAIETGLEIVTASD